MLWESDSIMGPTSPTDHIMVMIGKTCCKILSKLDDFVVLAANAICDVAMVKLIRCCKSFSKLDDFAAVAVSRAQVLDTYAKCGNGDSTQTGKLDY